MSLLFSLIGALIYTLLPWAIGQKILKNDIKAGIALKAATGWFVVFLITLVIAMGGGLQANGLIALSILAFTLYGKTIGSGIRQLLNSIKAAFRTSSSIEKLLLLLIFILLGLRAFQSLIPSTNWDSLNQHLPLLSARLDQQNLDPIYHLPTDRRTPLSGILLKIPLYCFGQDGRSISLTFFGFYLIVLLQIWTLLSRLCSSKLAALFAVACFVSWTDIAVYFKHLGDEAFFCLFVIAIISALLLKPNSLRTHFMISLIMGLCCSIKLTAFFFIPFIACVYLVRNYRGIKPIMILACSACFFIFALTPYFKQKHDHHMIYPLQRWTNLMEFGPNTPEVFNFDLIKKKRMALGIENHRDNQKVSSHPFSKWVANFKKLIYLPLGPYFYWGILMLLFGLIVKIKFSQQKHFHFISLGLAAFIVTVCLNLAMFAWDFSSQALTRYLLPLWCIYAITLGIFFYEFSKAYKITKFLKFTLLLCLLFPLSLESKQVIQTLQKKPFQNSRDYWLEHSSDGSLIKAWQQLTQNQEPSTFYMGNASILFMQPQHHVAQVGNEVGWREPNDFLKHLTNKNFEYFVYSYSAEKIDPMYRLLKEHCIKSGRLSLIVSNSTGEIYQIIP